MFSVVPADIGNVVTFVVEMLRLHYLFLLMGESV